MKDRVIILDGKEVNVAEVSDYYAGEIYRKFLQDVGDRGFMLSITQIDLKVYFSGLESIDKCFKIFLSIHYDKGINKSIYNTHIVGGAENKKPNFYRGVKLEDLPGGLSDDYFVSNLFTEEMKRYFWSYIGFKENLDKKKVGDHLLVEDSEVYKNIAEDFVNSLLEGK